jgi:hypothetical protein
MYTAGLVLPDLTRGFVKNLGKLKEHDYGIYEPLAAGCLQHYSADKIFHGSAFFEWGTHACVEAVKRMRFESEVARKWFIGHILFELLVDRILVRHKPSVASDFYAQLNTLDQTELNQFISLHEHTNKDSFLKFYVHFRKVAYIKNYTDNNLFAYSLSRIILKAGLPALTLTDKMVLQECVWELEENEFKNAQQLLIELKEVFK